jgi:uncharacterized protein YbjT (DUF2867 family)
MILVTGATGNVGAELVGELITTGEPVRALVRVSDAELPDGVQRAVGDLNDAESVAPALAGAHGLFLHSGYQDIGGLLARAGSAGVERVVLLSGGAAAASDLNNPISSYMVTSEAAIRDSGVAWTILRPYAFMSNALRWAQQVRHGDTVTAPFAGIANAVIDPHDIARVAATALSSGDHAGQVYRLSGPESLLPEQQVRVLGAALGRDLKFRPQPDDEARAEMAASMPAEYVDAFFSYNAGGTLDESAVLPTVEEVTGTAPRTFQQWAERHEAAFR